jgi:tetrahydromethanopterin S-methyltransferase subunit G
MSQDIEKENLGAHVDICAIRYENLEKRLNNLEEKVEKLSELIQKSQNSMTKILVGTCGTIVAGILSTIIILLMRN